MKCVTCGESTRTLYTRPTPEGIRRRRLCDNGHRFSTFEVFLPGSVTTGTTGQGRRLSSLDITITERSR